MIGRSRTASAAPRACSYHFSVSAGSGSSSIAFLHVESLSSVVSSGSKFFSDIRAHSPVRSNNRRCQQPKNQGEYICCCHRHRNKLVQRRPVPQHWAEKKELPHRLQREQPKQRSSFSLFHQRKKRDSNPRTLSGTPFQSVAIGLSAILPMSIEEVVGVEPANPFELRFRSGYLRPLSHTSVVLFA